MHHDDDAPPLLRLPCYEPPGLVFEWSRAAWLRHTLLLGATGCGKTSLINEILWQLIHHAAGDPRHKLGLLILDPKGDETVHKVRDYATAAGRAADVIALDGVAPVHYDLFAGLRELRDVDNFARRLLFAASPMSRENAFWEDLRRNLLVAALTVLVSTSERLTFTEAVAFLSGWLMGPGTPTPPVAQRLTQFAQVLAAAAVLTPAERLQLQTTQDQVIYWRDLDSRMRGSAQATLLNVLQPLVSARAADYLSERGPTVFDPARAVREGKLLVGAANALTEPALAALLFRLLKLEFYAAIQARGVFSPAGHRLAGLLVDEAQLCLGNGDVEQLATLRSKGGFVVAATQGLSALGELLGASRRDALLLNFNTTFFFQTSEVETEVYALRRFGWRAGPPRTRIEAIGDLAVAEVRPGKPVLVCPPGTLAQLPPHTCFVALPGLTCLHAVWPAPRFYDPPAAVPVPVVPPSRFAEVRAAVLGGPPTAENLDLSEPFHAEAARTHRLMLAAGARLRVGEELLAEVLRGFSGARNRQADLAALETFFRTRAPVSPSRDSVATLPDTWLPAVLAVLRRHLDLAHEGRLPYAIAELGCVEGRLAVRFCHQVLAEEGNAEADEWTQRQEDQLRVQLQRAVYPSLYRPLKPCHFAGFWHHAPHLRTLLQEQR